MPNTPREVEQPLFDHPIYVPLEGPSSGLSTSLGTWRPNTVEQIRRATQDVSRSHQFQKPLTPIFVSHLTTCLSLWLPGVHRQYGSVEQGLRSGGFRARNERFAGGFGRRTDVSHFGGFSK